MSTDLQPKTVEEGEEPIAEHPVIAVEEAMMTLGIPQDIANLFSQMLLDNPEDPSGIGSPYSPKLDVMLSKIRPR